MSARGASVMLVDDEQTSRHAVRRFLELKGLRVEEAADAATALELARRSPPDAAILDHRLPDGTALDLIAQLKALDPEVACFVLTGYGSIELAVRAIKEGAEQFLTKPVDLDTLHVLLERALERQKRQRRARAAERDAQSATLDPFVGPSAAIRRLAEEARRVANSGRPLLLLGETGVGKGVLARWIHTNGPRAAEPMVDINCAGIARELLESELFGHTRGAFTGATASKPGLIEVAHRGTIFLDEIGDMPLEAQPKLLKVLEEGRLRRVGEVEDRAVDLWLIAATNRDLQIEVAERRFRSDLYFRISTIPLRVPPLRERTEDLGALAEILLERFGRELGRPELHLSPTALAALERQEWPGNLRQLRNVLERAALLADDHRIEPSHLGLEWASATSGGARSQTLDEVCRHHIEAVLRAEHGHVERSARRLGLSRSGLYKKMRRLGLDASTS